MCGVAGCASMGSDARTQEGGREAAAAAASAAAVSACQLAAAVAAVESAVGSVGVPGRGGRCRPPLVAADRVFLPQASLGSRVKGGARPSANCVSPFRSVQHDGQSMSMDVVIRDIDWCPVYRGDPLDITKHIDTLTWCPFSPVNFTGALRGGVPSVIFFLSM